MNSPERIAFSYRISRAPGRRRGTRRSGLSEERNHESDTHSVQNTFVPLRYNLVRCKSTVGSLWAWALRTHVDRREAID